MSEPVDLIRFSRIARKRKEHGRESLTDEERAYYHQCMRTMRPMLKKLSETVNDPRFQEGYAAWERMTPEEQEKYEDWTPVQLQAFLQLIEQAADEDDQVY